MPEIKPNVFTMIIAILLCSLWGCTSIQDAQEIRLQTIIDQNKQESQNVQQAYRRLSET